MADINQIPVTVVQPGEGEHVALLGDVATRTIWNAGSEPGCSYPSSASWPTNTG